MKKFYLYKNKNDIFSDTNFNINNNDNYNKIKTTSTFNNKNKNNNIDNDKNYEIDKISFGKSNKIDDTKKRIDILRKKLLEEESNLLDLYKLKQ